MGSNVPKANHEIKGTVNTRELGKNSRKRGETKYVSQSKVNKVLQEELMMFLTRPKTLRAPGGTFLLADQNLKPKFNSLKSVICIVSDRTVLS